MTIDRSALTYFSAAYFYRRAGKRDRMIAVRALMAASQRPTSPIQRRAQQTLKEIKSGTDAKPASENRSAARCAPGSPGEDDAGV